MLPLHVAQHAVLFWPFLALAAPFFFKKKNTLRAEGARAYQENNEESESVGGQGYDLIDGEGYDRVGGRESIGEFVVHEEEDGGDGGVAGDDAYETPALQEVAEESEVTDFVGGESLDVFEPVKWNGVRGKSAMGTLRRGLSRLRSPFKKRGQSAINLRGPRASVEAEPVAVGSMYGSAITFAGQSQTIKAPPVPARSSTMNNNNGAVNSALSAAAMRARLRGSNVHGQSTAARPFTMHGGSLDVGTQALSNPAVLNDSWLGSGDKRASAASLGSMGGASRRNSMPFDEEDEEGALESTYEQFVLQPGYKSEVVANASGSGVDIVVPQPGTGELKRSSYPIW